MIAWEPGRNAAVRSRACPPSSGTVASAVVPSKKVTVPSTGPAAGFAGAAVATRVTGCPNSGAAVSVATVSEVPYRKETTAFPSPRFTPGRSETPVAEGVAKPLPPPPPAPYRLSGFPPPEPPPPPK